MLAVIIVSDIDRNSLLKVDSTQLFDAILNM